VQSKSLASLIPTDSRKFGLTEKDISSNVNMENRIGGSSMKSSKYFFMLTIACFLIVPLLTACVSGKEVKNGDKVTTSMVSRKEVKKGDKVTIITEGTVARFCPYPYCRDAYITLLPKGTILTVEYIAEIKTGTMKVKWFVVTHNEKQGWVSSYDTDAK